MKLYTEEQVIQILYWMSPTYIGREQIEERIKKELTPIELPSDEEMSKESGRYNFGRKIFFFLEGAKWMKEQISNQNK